jgi:hypothetical protein
VFEFHFPQRGCAGLIHKEERWMHEVESLNLISIVVEILCRGSEIIAPVSLRGRGTVNIGAAPMRAGFRSVPSMMPWS